MIASYRTTFFLRLRKSWAEDSLGNERRTEAGDVQVTGAGIRHAEYNLEGQPTQIFQSWIIPSSKGGSPAWGSNRSGRFVTPSGFDNDKHALPIRARARVLAAMLKAGEAVEYAGETDVIAT